MLLAKNLKFIADNLVITCFFFFSYHQDKVLAFAVEKFMGKNWKKIGYYNYFWYLQD